MNVNQQFMSAEIRKKIFPSPSRQSASERFEFKVAWGAIPHPDKAWKGGEDAVFANKNALVVADGVSGWSKMGIDSGIYSKKLVSNIRQALEGGRQLYYIEHPDELAQKAVQETEEKGSSTLTILTLHPTTGIMRSYHIGDSVFGIFRPNGQLFIAEEQQQQFDMPYQVYGGKINCIEHSRRENSRPSDVFRGEYNQFSLAEISNSPIVVASDGLWDNLHLKEISQTLGMVGSDLREKTQILLERAMRYCELPEYASPYYHKGLKKGLSMDKKGKLDDVSIILAEIIRFSF